METPALYEFMFKGSLAGVELGGQVIALTIDTMKYLEAFAIDQSVDTDDNFKFITEIDDQIKILFTFSKIQEAWDAIEENKEKIDYMDISQCPYFRIDVERTELFKYLYNSGIIDEASYAYLNVSKGEFYDEDFAKEYFSDCETSSDFFEKLYKTYNGALAEIGYLKLTDTIDSIMTNLLKDNEDLTQYIIGKKTAILFMPDRVNEFINSGNIPNTDYYMVFGYLDNNDNISDDDVNSIVHNMMCKVVDMQEIDRAQTISRVQLSSWKTFRYVLETIPRFSEDENNELFKNTLQRKIYKRLVFKIILNSFKYAVAPMIAYKMVEEICSDEESIEVFEDCERKFDLYISECNMCYRNLHTCNPRVTTNMISSPTYLPYFIIVNPIKSCIYLGNSVSYKIFDLNEASIDEIRAIIENPDMDERPDYCKPIPRAKIAFEEATEEADLAIKYVLDHEIEIA